MTYAINHPNVSQVNPSMLRIHRQDEWATHVTADYVEELNIVIGHANLPHTREAFIAALDTAIGESKKGLRGEHVALRLEERHASVRDGMTAEKLVGSAFRIGGDARHRQNGKQYTAALGNRQRERVLHVITEMCPRYELQRNSSRHITTCITTPYRLEVASDTMTVVAAAETAPVATKKVKAGDRLVRQKLLALGKAIGALTGNGNIVLTERQCAALDEVIAAFDEELPEVS